VKRVLAPLIFLAVMALGTSSTFAARPVSELRLTSELRYSHGAWTDADGASCLSDENLWNRQWSADKFSGTLTASLYLCPENSNAPSGSAGYSLWAAFAIANGNGSADINLTHPDGSVVAGRPNVATGWTEVCVIDSFEIPAGVYTLNFVADRARSPVVNFQTAFGESVRGRYWWGCDSSWHEVAA
jgi:hypothetical protein